MTKVREKVRKKVPTLFHHSKLTQRKGPPSWALALCVPRCSALHLWGRVAGPEPKGSGSGPQRSGKASTWVRVSPQTPQGQVRALAGSSCTGSSPFWSSMYSTIPPRRNILSPKLYILAVSIYIIYTCDGEIQRTVVISRFSGPLYRQTVILGVMSMSWCTAWTL